MIMKQAGLRILIVLIALLGLTLGCEYVRPTMNAPLARWNPIDFGLKPQVVRNWTNMRTRHVCPSCSR
jgi:hypothetical protein